MINVLFCLGGVLIFMSKRKTHEQFVGELAEKNPDVEVLGNYKNTNAKILVRCKICDYEWNATPNNLLQGYGCRKCAGTLKRTQEQFVKDLKKKNPNIFVLGEYVTVGTKILVRCKVCGHEWNVIPNNLLRGSGCPECNKISTSYFEQVVLYAFRSCLGDDAVLHRDRNLIGMELDVYIPSLNFAIEYGGWYWHKNRVSCDSKKRDFGFDNGVCVVTIYDLYDCNEDISSDNVWIYSGWLGYDNDNLCRSVIDRLFVKAGMQNKLSDGEWECVKNKAYVGSRVVDEVEIAHKTEFFVSRLMKKNSNVEVLGNYENNKTKILVRCKVCGHEWDAIPSSLLQGYGCPECARINRRKTHKEFVKELFKVNSDVEVLGQYVGNKTKILAKCKVCGHEWNVIPNNLLSGSGCPECAVVNRVIKCTKTHKQFVKELFDKNPNVEVLGNYENTNTKILVRCKVCGHEWSPIANDLLRGRGCRRCFFASNNCRRTHDEFVEKLSVRNPNLEILGRYVSCKTKILTKCKVCGHEWMAIPNGLLQGTGCPNYRYHNE